MSFRTPGAGMINHVEIPEFVRTILEVRPIIPLPVVRIPNLFETILQLSVIDVRHENLFHLVFSAYVYWGLS